VLAEEIPAAVSLWGKLNLVPLLNHTDQSLALVAQHHCCRLVVEQPLYRQNMTGVQPQLNIVLEFNKLLMIVAGRVCQLDSVADLLLGQVLLVDKH